jgi:hypothetical protein
MLSRLAVGSTVLAAPLALAAVAVALPRFTTAPKTAAGGARQAEAYGLTAACHASFDRVVVRVRAGTPGYDVRSVRRVVQDGSGRVVSLQGRRRIHLVLHNARGHTAGGRTLLPAVRTPLCPTLRQVKRSGDFEGVVSFGLGLRRRTGFRVFRLSGPARVVVDVAH